MTLPTNLIGQKFGQYELIQFLGRGGFAEVYLGQDNAINHKVAIKVLLKLLVETQAEKFKREAALIASFHHPNIIQFHSYNIFTNFNLTTTLLPYIVMEYAPNGSLRKNQPKNTPLDISLIVSYATQIAAALQFAHNQGILHLDVKPENILVGSQRELLLSDFGLATILSVEEQSTDIKGTLSYMAPERLNGQPEKASDQYALGIMVYEWLNGSVPFTGLTVEEVINKHYHMQPPPLQIFPDIEAVVMRSLAKKPEERYNSVNEFATALEQAVRRSDAGNIAGNGHHSGEHIPGIALELPVHSPPPAPVPSSDTPEEEKSGSPFLEIPRAPLASQSAFFFKGTINPMGDALNRPFTNPHTPIPGGPDSTTLINPGPASSPPFAPQPDFSSNGAGGMASQTLHSHPEKNWLDRLKELIELRSRSARRRQQNLLIYGNAAHMLAAIFIGIWSGQIEYSPQNETAWWIFIFSLLFSTGAFSLFFISGHKLLNLLLVIILGFYWCIAGFAFATVIGAGSRITFLPDADVMSVLFLLGSLGLLGWMLFKRK